MKKKYFILFVILLLTTKLTYSQFVENKDQVFEKIENNKNVLAKAEKLMQNNQPAFEENKGQITGEDASKVKYVFKNSGLSVFLMQTGIAYQFTKIHHAQKDEKIDKTTPFSSENKYTKDFIPENIRTETYRMDAELVDANLNAKITTEGKSGDYTMYYNHNALNVHSYTKITYHNIYPHIDWVLYTHENSLKYDFIIHPGGNPEQIKIKTKWVEDLQVTKSGSLQLKNQMGVITEKTPVSFQENEKIKTEFIVKEDIITFKLDSYNKEKTLIIDPTLQWATYYGGNGDDRAYSCAVDGSGNVYLTGNTEATTGIASGGHQNTYGGGSGDAYLVKFNSSGVRQWATYYGGTGYEGVSSCVVDGLGNVYFTGTTFSTSGIASGGHQNTFGGDRDAFLVKLDASGTRQWATYYGGSDEDQGYSCAVDGSGNVCLAGFTASTTGIASGGHQNTFGTSNYDDYIVKFNSSGVRQWGTYYGGRGYYVDRPSCAMDGLGNVYLTSSTSSASGIASGGHQNTSGGGYDAYLVKFNSSGARQWGTYYGGASHESVHSCTIDGSGNIYLAGVTQSTSAIAFGGYQNTNAGGYDAYLVKFNSSGTRQWGTYYGGVNNETGLSCAVDVSGNIYLSGTTLSTSNIAFLGHQNTYGGGITDAYLVKFDPSGSTRLWGTYYGGTGDEEGQSCAVDGAGYVYLAGFTTSTNNIAYLGHQNTYGGGSWDAFLAKFNSCFTANNSTTTTAICEGSTKTLTGTPSGGTWTVISGSGTITGTTYSTGSITANETVTIRYAIPASGGCPASQDDVSFTVNDNSNTANNTTSTAAICINSTKTLTGTPTGGTWSIVSGGGSISGTTYTAPATPSTIIIRYTAPANGACPATTSDITFSVNDNTPADNSTTTTAICEGSTKTLTGTPSGGTWTVISGSGTITGTTYSTGSITANETVTIRYAIPASGGCPASQDDVSFTVNDNSNTANNTTSTAAICINSTKTLTGTPTGGTWSIVSGGGSISGTTYTAPATPSTIIIRYTAPANGACPATTSDVTFSVNDNTPADNSTTTTAICEGSTKTLTGTPAGGTWTVINGSGTITGTTYSTGSITANETVTIRYAIPASGGCPASQDDVSFTVNDNSNTANNTTSTAAICINSTKTLTGSPTGGTWSIVSGGGSISGTTYTAPATTATIIIRYTAPANGACPATTSDVTFSVNNTPSTITCPLNINDTLIGTCEFTLPDYTNNVVFIDNCNTGTTTYSQSPTQGTVVQLNENNTTTTVVITATNNGNNSTCQFSLNLLCIPSITIPEFISPNGDGKNDTWEIKGIEAYDNTTVKIFNRWGSLAYTKDKYDNSWNGESNTGITAIKSGNKTLPSGTYFYIVIVSKNGIETPYKSYIQITK